MNMVTQIIGLDNLAFSEVTDINQMFENMSSLVALDFTGTDWSNISYMGKVFSGMSSLESLDLSNVDNRNVKTEGYMFNDTNALAKITIGENFKFTNENNIKLPEVPKSDIYTGCWINIGSGTLEYPNGKNIWTSSELTTNYNGKADADTYVWQKNCICSRCYS